MSDRDELAQVLSPYDHATANSRVGADAAWAAGWRKKPSVSGLAAILDSATAMLCPRCGLQVPTEREWEETPEGEGREMCWDAPGCIQSDYGRLDIARAAAILALMDGPTETGEK